MEILNLIQGSDEWIDARLKYLCASEAPAMMGCSKFMSRNQLLALKKGWLSNPVGDFKQRLYDKGHEGEESAREHVEFDICEDIPASVGLTVIDGLELLSSYDGLGATRYIWEHKLWNEILSENVRNGILEPLYYWQLEHQMLTADVSTCHFSVSDGGSDNRVEMHYQSVPQRRAELIAGWKQFNADLEVYEIEARQEVAVAAEVENLPLVEFRVEGSMIISNIKDCLPAIKSRAEKEMSRVLESDQDFADKERLNKDTKAARAKLKEVLASVQGEFISYSEFATTAADIDSILQKMQSAGEKQVKQQKEAKKQAIIQKAVDDLNSFNIQCNEKLAPKLLLSSIIQVNPDFITAMKNKRTIESWQNAVDDELARVKVEINGAMDRIIPNLEYLRVEGKDFAFLFSDAQQIINQGAEPFQAIIKSRIADHKEAEEEKLKAERERIRLEEEDKAKSKIEEEQRALRVAEEQAYMEEANREAVKQQQADHDSLAADSEASTEQKPYEPALSLAEVVSEAIPELGPVFDQQPRETTRSMSSPGPGMDKVEESYAVKTRKESLMGELADWCDKYNMSLIASRELKQIVDKYGIN
jgi:predicted phage-related endonuclease